MEIRKATPDDFEQVKGIKLRAKAVERRYNKSLKTVRKNRRRYLSYLRGDLASRDRAVLVAMEAGTPVGIITGRIHWTLPIRVLRRWGVISNLFVMPGHRNKGVATGLARELLKWFRQRKIKEVRLAVYARNAPALGMFRKLRFREHAVEMQKNL